MKEVLADAGVPTARFAAFEASQGAEAVAYLETLPGPWVIKTDGLAAGKGVLVAGTMEEARADVEAKLSGAAFGEAGRRIVIEEGLAGEECSLLVLYDGTTAVPLLPAQDFKRVGEGDSGPNTGGMGAYAPLPWLPDDVYSEIVGKIAEPVAAELVRRGSPFSGLLYIGLAITKSGPAVVEFNCRFGDPETQAVLALLDSPLGQLLHAAGTGTLADFGELRWRDGAAVTVVLAAENYPGRPRVGDVVVGSEAEGVLHAGTARRDDAAIVSSGGRVLSVVGTGADLSAARTKAYDILDSIRLPGSHFRGDIALAAAEGKIGV
jgi:phosphoribosylamine--glycine ligase